jgi:hypothetical protein
MHHNHHYSLHIVQLKPIYITSRQNHQSSKLTKNGISISWWPQLGTLQTENSNYSLPLNWIRKKISNQNEQARGYVHPTLTGQSYWMQPKTEKVLQSNTRTTASLLELIRWIAPLQFNWKCKKKRIKHTSKARKRSITSKQLENQTKQKRLCPMRLQNHVQTSWTSNLASRSNESRNLSKDIKIRTWNSHRYQLHL